MVFSSMLFLFAFFAVTIPVHSLLKSVRAKNIWLLVTSLVFYSWASLKFTLILLLETAVCWFFALRIEEGEGRLRRRLLALCVTVVLLVLGAFKYLGFLLSGLRALTGVPRVIPDIALPLGISFYTFQLISYVADVYRGRVEAQRRFWMLLLYASLFHQCVAGPIVRYGDMAQALERRTVTAADTSRGVSRFAAGLAKKAILANSCAVVADTFFTGSSASLASQPAAGLWLSALAYMLQIYLDFSAYSDMASGMGLMCGFRYPKNFNYPYVSTSLTDFWRRWHMTLGGFFRDYVYIPLGGSRRGRARQVFNLLVVWSLTGLWHGASWNYVIWGLYFFVLLVTEKLVLGKRLYRIPAPLRYVAVTLLVCLGWVVFRFEDLGALGTALAGLFGLNGNPLANAVAAITFKSNWALLLVSAVACTPLCRRLGDLLRAGSSRSGAVCALFSAVEAVSPALLLLLSAVMLTGNSYNPFIYWTF